MKEEDIVKTVLKKYKKAKRIAVRNFVLTAPDNKLANQWNLADDTKMYGWNGETYAAIHESLRQLNKI